MPLYGQKTNQGLADFFRNFDQKVTSFCIHKADARSESYYQKAALDDNMIYLLFLKTIRQHWLVHKMCGKFLFLDDRNFM
jgi:hypothetical protein